MKTKYFSFLIIPVLLIGCSSKNKSNVPSGYKLFFEDEFEGDKLSKEYWTYETGNGNNGWGNGELEYYTEENAIVKDGKLHITVKREDMGGFKYTSSRIKTANKVKFKYGIVEAKIKLPHANGLWPAFWMMPNDSVYGGWPNSGEIDIMEANCGYEYGTSSALHYSVTPNVDTYETGYNNMKTRDYTSSITEEHVYKLDWKEESITFYVDDRLIKEIPQRTWSSGNVDKEENPYAPFDQDFYIIFNMAVGGNYVKDVAPDEDFVSGEMIIDYVRVYTYEGDN